MKWTAPWLCAACLWAASSPAQSPVTLTIDPRAAGAAIPDHFLGMSFGMRALLPNKTGAHFFNPTNTALITVFQNLGLTHLRVGGTTVEWPADTAIPDHAAIDDLFAFAHAAGVKKIIYSLRLLQTDPSLHYETTDAAIARYIWDHYRPDLEAFSIGNEPDGGAFKNNDPPIANFPAYFSQWRQFAAAITNAVPGATFAGPDAASHGDWIDGFADGEKGTGRVSLITLHTYPGGRGRGVTADKGIDSILSPARDKGYQSFYDRILTPVLADGFPFMFTEANDHYSGGITNASDTLAGALWALDFLHWWAAHGARGVDFHNTQWVVNDTIYTNGSGGLRINPKGYGIKAFALGGRGRVTPVAISNPEKMNLTAYAVRDGGDLFVTIINREHGPGARAADVVIAPGEATGRIEAIFLTGPDGDVAAKEGVTLGGATLDAAGPWLGKWTPLPAAQAGRCAVKVAAAAAAVVKIAVQ